VYFHTGLTDRRISRTAYTGSQDLYFTTSFSIHKAKTAFTVLLRRQAGQADEKDI
jgi:hypothetical protein